MDLWCSICGKKISRDWYCYGCYKEYQIDIESKQPWTRFLQSEEKRRRRKRDFLIYLGDSRTGEGQIWQVGNQKALS